MYVEHPQYDPRYNIDIGQGGGLSGVDFAFSFSANTDMAGKCGHRDNRETRETPSNRHT